MGCASPGNPPSCPSHLPQAGASLGWHFWLLDLPSTGIQSIEQRLHFHANLLASLLAASALFAGLPVLVGAQGMKPSQCVARLEGLPLSAVYAVFLSIPDGAARRNLHAYLHIWRNVRPKTNGYDLIERGLPAGPRYQQVLERLRQAWLDGEVTTEREEINLLDSLMDLD